MTDRTDILSLVILLALTFADIVILWLLIALYIIISWGISHLAAILFVPYLCWVGFATTLNFSIWMLNR